MDDFFFLILIRFIDVSAEESGVSLDDDPLFGKLQLALDRS